MFKKLISYVDYDGNEREEEHYFNLTKSELMEMELTTSGGMEQMIRGIISAQDNGKIVQIFKNIILKSYGIKSPDGKRFIKSPEITEEFTQTGAYDVLFMELATDADKAAEFINGIIPQDLQKEVNNEMIKQGLKEEFHATTAKIADSYKND